MAIRATEGLTPTWFTPPDEQDADRPARFLLRPLTGAQQDEVMEGAVLEGGNIALTARGVRAALKYGLADWEHFEDSKGPIPFSPAAFDRLPWMRRQTLAGEILGRSELTGTEIKNS